MGKSKIGKKNKIFKRNNSLKTDKKKENKVDERKRDLLLAIKKDDDEIKMYEKLLNIKKKKKSFISDIFSSMEDTYSDDEDKMDIDVDNDEEIIDNAEISEEDEEVEDIEDEDVDENEDEDDDEDDDDDEHDEEEEEIRDRGKKSQSTKCNQITKNDKDVDNNAPSDLHIKIKRSLLQHLNKLCESQMMKCLDGVEEVWNSFPRGDVRDVFIKESIAYMKFSCIDLAAFVVCIHIRFSKHTNIIAFYMEHLMMKWKEYNQGSWSDDNIFSFVSSLCEFVAYVTRLEAIDCNLIMDMMTEMLDSFDLPHLKLLANICSILGFYLRKNSGTRCDTFVTSLKKRMQTNLSEGGDMNELRSYGEAIVGKLTLSKTKSDVVYESVDKYRKMMRKWCRNTSLSETIALKMADFQGDNRVRWWLVGSALDPNVAHSKSTVVHTNDTTGDKTFSDQELEWNGIAKSLGLATVGKQTLFRILMYGKARESQEDVGDIVEQVMKLTVSSGGVIAVSESDVVRTVVRCISLDLDFCPLYVNIIGAFLESHRRFRQVVKCSIWDVLAQPKLVESAKRNIGHCVGQLIMTADLPINILKKFNFMDDSVPNTAFMMAVMTEIFDGNWNEISEILTEAATTISTKFVGNLRLFLKKNFKVEDSERWGRMTMFKVTKSMELLQELRKGVS